MSLLCIIAQFSYLIYQVCNNFKHLKVRIVCAVYFLEITNVSLQHLIYLWTWGYIVKLYKQSLKAARDYDKKP